MSKSIYFAGVANIWGRLNDSVDVASLRIPFYVCTHKKRNMRITLLTVMIDTIISII